MTDLASLVVKLEAQTAQYDAALKKATSQLSTFQKGATLAVTAGHLFAEVIASSARAIVDFGAAAIDNADHIGKLAQSTGISTEALSQMAYAAELSDVSLEKLSGATAKLSKNAVAAAKGSKEATAAFKSIGVSATDATGKVRPVEELMLDVADKFSKLENGAEKAAAAQALFGKSGADLIPFLNQGRAGLAALMQEADAYGQTITGEVAAGAEQFNDNLTRMQATAKGLATQVAADVLPALTVLQENFLKSAQSGGNFNAAAKGLAAILKLLASGAVFVTSVFQQLGQVVYSLGAGIFRLVSGDFKGAADEIRSGFAQARDNVAADMKTIGDIWTAEAPAIVQANTEIKGSIDNVTAAEDAAAKAAEATAKARRAALDSVTGEIEALEEQVATYGKSAEEVARYRVEHGALAETLAKSGADGAAYAEMIVELTAELSRLRAEEEKTKKMQDEWNQLVEEGKRVSEQMRTPQEQYAATIERLNELLVNATISQEDYNRAVAAAQDKLGEALNKDDEFKKHMRENVQDVIADALVNGAEDGARGVLKSFVDMLLKMQAQALAADIASKLFGKPGDKGGGWLGAITGIGGAMFGGGAGIPSRDSGGRGSPGHAYRIGIGAQPETFVPDRPGSFYPRQSMQSNVTVKPQIINVRDPSEIPTALQSGGGEAAILNIIARNPSTIRQLLQG